jgi:ACS family hexuronate transporter-like MFS transporter
VIIPFIGLDLGYLASGFIVLQLSRRLLEVANARRLVLVAAATVMSISMVFTPLVKSDVAGLLLLFGGTFGMAAWNSNYLCFVEEVSARKVSAVAGVIGSAGAFAGALTLWLFGIISQAAGSFAPVFAIVGGMIWIASAGILLTREPGSEVASLGALQPATE